MLTMLLATALAGYGDAEDGRPSQIEREIHMWTNAVRMSPNAFGPDYQGAGCLFADFEDGEKVPQAPLAWNGGLYEAARVHSIDMQDNNFISHDSSDGTDTFTRIRRFYTGGYVGENVAQGYNSARRVVLGGWMCSSGHRSNIMASDFNEFGAGSKGVSHTQVFGRNNNVRSLLTMGVHVPEDPAGTVTLLADVDADPAPDSVEAILDGEPITMRREWGTKKRGTYGAEVDIDGGCHLYWFEATSTGEVVRFPEDGAYGFGDCDFDDAEAGWFSADSVAIELGWNEPGDTDAVDPGPGGPGLVKGCSNAPLAPTGALALLALAAVRRRR